MLPAGRLAEVARTAWKVERVRFGTNTGGGGGGPPLSVQLGGNFSACVILKFYLIQKKKNFYYC